MGRNDPQLPPITYSTYVRGLDGLWGIYRWLDCAPQGATRRASGGAATTSRLRAEPSRGCRWRNPRTRVLTTHRFRASFFGVSALLLAASVAVTIFWSASISAMGEMPMPGDWTMSMAWMRMPGQTWAGAAASFLGMWVVMMVAMMLPSVVRCCGATARRLAGQAGRAAVG